MEAVKKEFVLEGLDCADCAAKIEGDIKGISGVAGASVNFALGLLSIEAASPEQMDRVVREARGAVKAREPGVRMLERAHGHAHAHSHDGASGGMPISGKKAAALAAGAVLFVLALTLKPVSPLDLTMFLAAYLLIGGEVLYSAARNISRGQVFDENFLMALATVGAFAIGEYPEGVAVMLFYQVGEFFQELAVKRSRKSIAELMDIRPDYANLLEDGRERRVSPHEVGIGDSIIVRPGEKIPLDGLVTDGFSALDTSALTGESAPRDVQPGSEALSGSVNRNGVLTIKVEKAFGESTVSKILELVQNAASKKSPTEKFITKFARYYTPIVVFAAAALAFIPPLVIEGATFTEWINRALVFLVVSCPCALVISIPLGFFGGIGRSSSKGILVKGGSYLEALSDVDTVVFDKTGTLTKGVFKVSEISPAGGFTADELLKYAALAESYSTHPIARSVLREYGDIPEGAVSGYNELPGRGVSARVEGKTVLAGNDKLMLEHGLSVADTGSATTVHVMVDGAYAGYIGISDEIKPDTKAAVDELRSLGVRRIVMLTGDGEYSARSIGAQAGINEVYFKLLPGMKVEIVEKLQQERRAKGSVVFAGDGINDAPVLARADVGVAMGGVGSDAAIEAADVVLMTDEPSKIASAIRIARYTRSVVTQNIVLALGIKGVILVMGAFGAATMWMAVFGDVGVALLAILNSMRIMYAKA